MKRTSNKLCSKLKNVLFVVKLKSGAFADLEHNTLYNMYRFLFLHVSLSWPEFIVIQVKCLSLDHHHTTRLRHRVRDLNVLLVYPR